MIDGLYKAGNMAVALEVISVMEKSGVRANTHIHDMVIHSLCMDRMVDSALQILDEMVRKGVYPNVYTYSSLIFGLCNLC